MFVLKNTCAPTFFVHVCTCIYLVIVRHPVQGLYQVCCSLQNHLLQWSADRGRDWSWVWRLEEFSHFYYVSLLTLCCECRTESAREERGRQKKVEEEKWAYPSTLLLAGQFGRAEGRYCYLWIKHEPISLDQSTIFYIFSLPSVTDRSWIYRTWSCIDLI